MIYAVDRELIQRKASAWLTNQELANALQISPGNISAKLNGFVIMTAADRRAIIRTIEAAENLRAGAV